MTFVEYTLSHFGWISKYRKAFLTDLHMALASCSSRASMVALVSVQQREEHRTDIEVA